MPEHGSSSPGTSIRLEGKTVVIPRNISVRGWLTDAGSRALEGFTALEDATVIARLKQAGARLEPGTTMSELGFGLSGDGRSGHLGEGAVALMTDTMGEARIAAACEGWFGFKATYGVVSRFGTICLIPSLEGCGVIAATVGDVQSVMAVISGKDERDFSMPDDEPPEFHGTWGEEGKACTVGVVTECVATLTAGERKAFEAGLRALREAGFAVREVGLPEYTLFRAVHQVVGSVEASSSGGKYDGVRYGHRAPGGKNWNDMYLRSRGESFGTLVKSYLFQGAYFQFENYPSFENACRLRGRLVRAAAQLFEGVDFLALPTRREGYDTSVPSSVEATYDVFSLTLPANVTGHPVIQIPGLAVDSGKDTGLQLMGPRLSDARLLAAARHISSVARGVNHP